MFREWKCVCSSVQTLIIPSRRRKVNNTASDVYLRERHHQVCAARYMPASSDKAPLYTESRKVREPQLQRSVFVPGASRALVLLYLLFSCGDRGVCSVQRREPAREWRVCFGESRGWISWKEKRSWGKDEDYGGEFFSVKDMVLLLVLWLSLGFEIWSIFRWYKYFVTV